jgi:phosphoserine aminotransferase
MAEKPSSKTLSPLFGCGPVRKPHGWSLCDITYEPGRSHRSGFGVGRLETLEKHVRHALDIPKNYKVAFLTGSATAATEAGLWNLIGTTELTLFDFDTFANRWLNDIVSELKPSKHINHISINFGESYTFHDEHPENDLLFCWNGSTSGMIMPNLDWIDESRTGLVFCDATSATYCTPLPFEKMDVTTFSFQKGLAAEAGLGCLVLSEKAYDRLLAYDPQWPIPRLLRIKDDDCAVFQGKLLNTPSMFCIEEIIYCHQFFNKQSTYDFVQNNKKVFQNCLHQTSIFKNVIDDDVYQSCCTGVFQIIDSVFLRLDEKDQRKILSKMGQRLHDEKIAFDFINHPTQPPSLRIWLGPTMDPQNIEQLFPWLVWAYKSIIET